MSDKHAYDHGETCEEDEASEALARDRTDMAEDRTIMAVERTFAGWIRTAFAAIGIGLAFRVLFGELQPPWLAKAIASMFIGFAIFLALNAEKRARRSLERMKTHAVEGPDHPRFRLLAWGVSVGAAVLIAGLWILNDGDLTG
ncbi:YidH family protein [Alteraurantiacibacter aquimixticola]|uniref:DUF202 domain-containing protein n=1 Tax=Alteraurantiacibacter aquimixticola TaxID=2489173 RepID=A0A4T3F3Y4_9SPHN|nr:DUF202 domain-containing protein [Alteraurantiacibacter aquimixticola]TIX49413.1 DUF202 domain-containing protein [Alteraurantiacibacter aquimixticola]